MLSPATRLGPYEILAPLGAGGMGEVYRARDTRLDRTVAVKVLPKHFAADAEFRQRFEREAHALSTLNHPHICTIYDVGRQDDVEFLVLEHVEGETLADRLKRGAMPIAEVIRHGVELADALDRAHRAAVIHRDLKPANVMLTKAGIKVLDFGLARFKVSEPHSLVSAPTMRSPDLTSQGTILGTLQYMSPEQLDGREVDPRSDIFALGTVLYEMATGRQAFEAKSQASLIAAILEHEPAPIAITEKSGPLVSAALDRIVRRCLAKDPDDRWQSARDVVLELKTLADGVALPVAQPSGRSRGSTRERVAWTVAAMAIAIAVAAPMAVVWYARSTRVDAPELRLQVVTPPSPAPIPFALSPDGRNLVFIATSQGKTQTELWIRALNTVGSQRLAGTEGGLYPFWSPDSRSIGFFADAKLKRYDLSSAAVQILATAPLGRGGTWNRDGTIVFAATVGPLQRIPALGGEPLPLTQLETPLETSHRFPQFLPDGRRFLYFVQGRVDTQGVYLASLEEPRGRRLLAADSHATFAPPYTLLFLRQATLFAQRLDLEAGTLVGEPTRVADQVAFDAAFNTSAISASSTGLIAYRVGSASELVWVDRTGKPIDLGPLPASGPQNCPELSPDGRRVALDRTVSSNRDVWIQELTRGVTTRLTFDAGGDATPIWSPDGTRLAFRSNRSGVNEIYLKSASGAGGEERVASGNQNRGVADWSPDGNTILYMAIDQTTGLDLWALPLTGDRKPFVVAQTVFEEREGQFSPDGRWIAFASNESGRIEVYVQPFPGPGPKSQVSTSGGSQPRWRRDGRELFYLALDGMVMSTPISTSTAGASIEAGAPVPLFVARITSGQGGLLRQQYDVSADGKRFLLNAVSEAAATAPITIIANWNVR